MVQEEVDSVKVVVRKQVQTRLPDDESVSRRRLCREEMNPNVL